MADTAPDSLQEGPEAPQVETETGDAALLIAEGSAPASMALPEPVAVIVEPGLLAKVLWLLGRAFVAAYEDNCFSIAKGAAYSGLLSLFPVLTTIAAILVQIRAEAVVHLISRILFQLVPPGTEELILSHFKDEGNRPIGLLIGATILSLWAASGAMLSLMEGFDAAYRLPGGRGMLAQRGISVLLVLIVAVPAVLASTAVLLGNREEATVFRWLGLAGPDQEVKEWLRILWLLVRYLVAFFTTVLVTGLLYYCGPYHRSEARSRGTKQSRFWRVWPGALIATVMWMVATAGFGWYVTNIARYNVIYGALGAGIILLVWMYLLAVISLVGCEFNAERERSEALLSLY
jgi:membrane protein